MKHRLILAFMLLLTPQVVEACGEASPGLKRPRNLNFMLGLLRFSLKATPLSMPS